MPWQIYFLQTVLMLLQKIRSEIKGTERGSKGAGAEIRRAERGGFKRITAEESLLSSAVMRFGPAKPGSAPAPFEPCSAPFISLLINKSYKKYQDINIQQPDKKYARPV